MGPTTLLCSIGNAICLFAFTTLAGSFVFLTAVWRRTLGRDDWGSAQSEFYPRWTKMVFISWWAALAGSLLCIIATVESRENLYVTRFYLLLLAGLAWIAVRRGFPPYRGLDGRWDWRPGRERPAVDALAVGIVVALATTTVLTATDQPVIDFVTGSIQRFALAAWVGSLLLLLFAARPALREAGEHRGRNLLRRIARRYADLAVVSVLALLAATIVRALVRVPVSDPSEVVLGSIRFAAIVIVGILVVRRRLKIRPKPGDDPEQRLRYFEFSLAAETALAISVLVVSGIMLAMQLRLEAIT